MTDKVLGDRLKLAGQAAARGAHRLRAGAAMPLRVLSYLKTRRPARLLIAPQDIRTADPTIANDIYGGYFAFGGKAVQLRGQSPFEVDPPSVLWSRNLMGFGWLRHLRAADTPLTRANARALVTDWLALAQRGLPLNSGAVAYEPRVVARRLLSWLSHSPIILDEATLPFYKQFLARIARETNRLQAALSEGLEGDARLLAAVAIAQVSLCVEGFERLQKKASRQLGSELTTQILPDGGHISRNPHVLAELLIDLLPLRQAYSARSAAPPPELNRAVGAMMPMLRMLRHGNGEIALFNGMGATAPDLLATVLAYDDGRAPTPASAPQSGYERRQLADCLVLVDTGRQPPGPFSEETHAGTLAFEFSSLLNRIVVNCGAPAQEGTAFRQAARATAAHSTLTLADVSSSRFLHWQAGGPGWQRRVLSGPRHVVIEPAPADAGASVLASHDGYGPQFGWTHRRFLSIAESGTLLQGVDQLVSAGTKPGAAQDYALRFHLHPSITAAVSDDQAGVFLDLPGDESWYFSAGGLPLTLEESVFLGMPNGAQRSQQIIARANSGQCVEISWMFQRYPEQSEVEAPHQDDTETDAESGRHAAPSSDAPAAVESSEAEG